MVTIRKYATSDFEVPEPGVYTLEFIGHGEVTQVPSFNDPNKMQDRIRLDFHVTDFDYDPDEDERDWNGVRVSDFFTVSLHEKAKLTPVVVALRGGVPIEDDEDVSLEDLIGKQLMATLERTEKGYAKIVSAAPVRRKKKKATMPVTPDPFADDED